ncbi:MAG: hypothetical protein WBB98_17470 [Xanthobacteraceae bacterium]
MFETAENTREKRHRSKRQIKLPGKRDEYSARDPIEIARELRAKSKLGRKEAKLNAAEAKLGR